MELLLYMAGLGVSAAVIAPFLFGLVKNFLPASIQSASTLPSTYPSSGAAILWSVVLWGAFLGGAVWLISLVRPVGEAIRREG